LKEPVAGPEAEKKGVAGKKGDFGKAETLETEMLNGRGGRWRGRMMEWQGKIR
jgi:hypothetical protein